MLMFVDAYAREPFRTLSTCLQGRVTRTLRDVDRPRDT
jgi:hypothetical protein